LNDIYHIYKLLGKHYSEIGQHYLKVQQDIEAMGFDISIPSTECKNYLDHINTLTNMDRMMANVYVRVLADISGGRIIRNKLNLRKLPVSMYTFQSGLKGKIVTWINLEHENADAFLQETQCSFESYSNILN